MNGASDLDDAEYLQTAQRYHLLHGERTVQYSMLAMLCRKFWHVRTISNHSRLEELHVLPKQQP